ncbi:MAG: kinase/pyrophosphorylase [Zoogloeaceae bacterium]|jgi:regulator of PEP synthase PpsR (kinase-PPPase family)|nr:kinase/pyrophosphorylase [Zoogloeaceae bacterium]
MPQARVAFFISDGTGITAEALGHSLLSQFESVRFIQERLPFIDTEEKARDAVARINARRVADGVRPIVFATLINPRLAEIVHAADALYISYFETFLAPLEAELGIQSSHAIGRTHGSPNSSNYKHRIDAINYTLMHDDGITDRGLEEADVVLVGVSRCGKTPTSLYLAMQFGLKVANFPLIPEDFERQQLPGSLEKHRGKLFGLTIQPERLAQIREERRARSHYASLANCRHEALEAERMMRREGIPWLDTSAQSIEEIATKVLQVLKLSERQDLRQLQ